MNPDLAAERAVLEQQIAVLRFEIEGKAALLDVERAAGLRPRGLLVGVVIGGLFVVAVLVTGFFWMLSTIGRMD